MYKVNLIQEYCKNLTNIVKPIKLKYSTTTPQSFTEQYTANIKFFKDDTLNVALKYNNPLILILADESRPGGHGFQVCKKRHYLEEQNYLDI